MEAIDLVPTALGVTSRLVSSLVIVGWWDSVSGAVVAFLAFVLSSACLSTSSSNAKGSADRDVGGRQRGRSGYRGLDEVKAGLQAEAEGARRAVATRTEKAARRVQALLGGPGSRLANNLNRCINVLLIALVIRQAYFAALDARERYESEAGYTLTTVETTANEATLRLESDRWDRLRVQIPKADYDECLDLRSAPVEIELSGLRFATAYEWRVTECDADLAKPDDSTATPESRLDRLGEFRTQMVDFYDAHGRCTLGMMDDGSGRRTTREVIHNIFLNSLCGPPGGRSMLSMRDEWMTKFNDRIAAYTRT